MQCSKEQFSGGADKLRLVPLLSRVLAALAAETTKLDLYRIDYVKACQKP